MVDYADSLFSIAVIASHPELVGERLKWPMSSHHTNSCKCHQPHTEGTHISAILPLRPKRPMAGFRLARTARDLETQACGTGLEPFMNGTCAGDRHAINEVFLRVTSRRDARRAGDHDRTALDEVFDERL